MHILHNLREIYEDLTLILFIGLPGSVSCDCGINGDILCLAVNVLQYRGVTF